MPTQKKHNETFINEIETIIEHSLLYQEDADETIEKINQIFDKNGSLTLIAELSAIMVHHEISKYDADETIEDIKQAFFENDRLARFNT